MRKFILSALVMSLMISCSDNESSRENADHKPTSMLAPEDQLSSNPDYQRGVELVGKYQCITCHKIDEKLTGPSYRDVAEKYAGANQDTVAQLSKKIIEGGSGVWGEVPMTPHPNVSQEEAEAMVKYILLLKK